MCINVSVKIWCCMKIRAVPNRCYLLFGRIQIIKTSIRPNTNRIRIVALTAMSNAFLGFS